MSYSYQVLTKILNENFGVLIFDKEQEDFSINDYIYDSITFIQFIIGLEEEIGRDLPDDFLNIELLGSAKGFTEMLDSYIESI